MRSIEHFGGFRRQLKKPPLHSVFWFSSAIVQIQMVRPESGRTFVFEAMETAKRAQHPPGSVAILPISPNATL
jgi:hypothetical protein